MEALDGRPGAISSGARAAAVLVDVHAGGVEARRLAALARRNLAHAAVAPRQRQRRERLRRRLRVELLRLRLLLLLRQPLLLQLLQLLQLRELVLLRLLLLERRERERRRRRRRVQADADAAAQDVRREEFGVALGNAGDEVFEVEARVVRAARARQHLIIAKARRERPARGELGERRGLRRRAEGLEQPRLRPPPRVPVAVRARHRGLRGGATTAMSS